MTPTWAQQLAAGPAGQGPPSELVAAAVRVALRGPDPRHSQPVLGGLLATAEPIRVEEVLAQMEQRHRRCGRLAEPAEVAEQARALSAHGACVLLPGYRGYPPQLQDAWPDLGAPAWLFARGAGLPTAPAVAVVGTRRPTLEGLDVARELGAVLARNGITVVSGLARGIDQAAHRGALDCGGATVGVLGTGFGVDYPRGDQALREDVAAAGGLCTELLPGAGPRPVHFLWRNRIISGLADAVVVVEGRARSGSLQTARLAASQGRDVWAVPGPLRAPTSRGPLDLVRDGAQLVTRFDDVVEAVLGRSPQASATPVGDDLADQQPAEAAVAGHPTEAAVTEPPADDAAERVLALVGTVPATPGRLAAASGLAVSEVLAAVSRLAAAGRVALTPNGVVRTSGSVHQGKRSG